MAWSHFSGDAAVTWVALISFVILAAEIAFFVYDGLFTFHKYTYWNLVITTVFFGWAFVATLTRGFPFKLLALYYYPIAFTSNAVVTVMINVILANNGYLFVSATEFGYGQVSVGTAHFGDFIMHPLPLFLLLFLLVTGLVAQFRAVVSSYIQTELRPLSTFVYMMYWFFSPLSFTLLYLVFFNPVREYRVSFPLGLWLVVGVALSVLFQFINLVWMLSEFRPRFVVPAFHRMGGCEH